MSLVDLALLAVYLIVYFTGALPKEAQVALVAELPFWSARLVGMGSSLVEIFLGYTIFRSVLFRSQMGAEVNSTTWLLGLVGVFFLIEGFLRLAVTNALRGEAMPSLPVTLAFRAVARMARSINRSGT